MLFYSYYGTAVPATSDLSHLNIALHSAPLSTPKTPQAQHLAGYMLHSHDAVPRVLVLAVSLPARVTVQIQTRQPDVASVT